MHFAVQQQHVEARQGKTATWQNEKKIPKRYLWHDGISWPHYWGLVTRHSHISCLVSETKIIKLIRHTSVKEPGIWSRFSVKPTVVWGSMGNTQVFKTLSNQNLYWCLGNVPVEWHACVGSSLPAFGRTWAKFLPRAQVCISLEAWNVHSPVSYAIQIEKDSVGVCTHT